MEGENNGSLLKGEMRGERRGGGGKLLFWSYLALGVTLQLLSLLSLARRLKRTVKRRRRKGRQRRRRWRAGQGKDERTREGRRGDDKGWRVKWIQMEDGKNAG